jgi:hypothetical protein
MSYWNAQGNNGRSTESFGLGGSTSTGGSGEFYELEPAVVLDIVLDKDHPIFKKDSNVKTTIDIEHWPSDYTGKAKPVKGDINYTWVGRALVRLQYSTPSAKKDDLVWAFPLEAGISEYPLINEIVMILKYRNKYFYSRRVNIDNFPNEAVDFGINPIVSGQPNTELYSNADYAGRSSKTNHDGTAGYKGVAGKYYKINNRIRAIKRYEGDTVLESRFGQSIRFSAYDAIRANDIGDKKNTDYDDYGGNPMILIRNRQRKLLKKGETLKLKDSPNPAIITGTEEEKNAGGFIKEDINHDGSSIHITTGQTESNWKPTCYKKMWGNGEEQPLYNGISDFKYPAPLNGDQIIIQSDRLIFSSRYGETFHYSKKRYAVVTDNEYTVDAHQQIVLTTNSKTVLNAPVIYLGAYDETAEPVLLGQSTVTLLTSLCDWLLRHIHKHEHSHVNAGAPSPKTTQEPTNPMLEDLKTIKSNLQACLSRRVFVVGGGLSPGADGGKLG